MSRESRSRGKLLTLPLSRSPGEAGRPRRASTLKTQRSGAQDAVSYENRLRSDNKFAEREQKRAQRKINEDGTGGKPLYCDSRYYKILAGGNGQGGVGCSN